MMLTRTFGFYLGICVCTALHAESIQTGSASGSVDQVLVDAAVKTSVELRRPGEDPEAHYQPLIITSKWQFHRDPAQPESVRFKVDIHFGDYYSITDAGKLGGTSYQRFYGVTQTIEGVGDYDPQRRFFSFIIEPKDRDDGRASTVTETQPRTCEPEGGTACKAFEKTSLEFEGARIQLNFSQNGEAFSGSMLLAQYGGSGFTRSQTDFDITLQGALQNQP